MGRARLGDGAGHTGRASGVPGGVREATGTVGDRQELANVVQVSSSSSQKLGIVQLWPRVR